jgi:hypothetical protein
MGQGAQPQARLQLHQLLTSQERQPDPGQPDKGIRDFWIEHTKRCRHIAEAMGQYQDDPCIMNIWVHDGSKDYTVEKYRYRQILKESLDEILAEQLPHMKPAWRPSSSASDWRPTPWVRTTSTPVTAQEQCHLHPRHRSLRAHRECERRRIGPAALRARADAPRVEPMHGTPTM